MIEYDLFLFRPNLSLLFRYFCRFICRHYYNAQWYQYFLLHIIFKKGLSFHTSDDKFFVPRYQVENESLNFTVGLKTGADYLLAHISCLSTTWATKRCLTSKLFQKSTRNLVFLNKKFYLLPQFFAKWYLGIERRNKI